MPSLNEYSWTAEGGALLGHGSFGFVYRGRNTVTGDKVAVKQIHESFLRQKYPVDFESHMRRLEEEKRVHVGLKHENIVCVFATGSVPINGQATHVLVMEMCTGDLDKLLVTNGSMPAPVLADFAVQFSSGLAFLHEHNIIHRDLKPGNILVSMSTDVPSRQIYKISDFGLCCEVRGDNLALTELGSPYFAAPEVAAHAGYGSAVDLWSAGVVLYYCATRAYPFTGASKDELLQCIRATCATLDIAAVLASQDRLRDAVLRDMPLMLAQTIRALLALDPAARSTAADLALRAAEMATPPVAATVVNTGAEVMLRPPRTGEALRWGDVRAAAAAALAHPIDAVVLVRLRDAPAVLGDGDPLPAASPLAIVLTDTPFQFPHLDDCAELEFTELSDSMIEAARQAKPRAAARPDGTLPTRDSDAAEYAKEAREYAARGSAMARHQDIAVQAVAALQTALRQDVAALGGEVARLEHGRDAMAREVQLLRAAVDREMARLQADPGMSSVVGAFAREEDGRLQLQGWASWVADYCVRSSKPLAALCERTTALRQDVDAAAAYTTPAFVATVGDMVTIVRTKTQTIEQVCVEMDAVGRAQGKIASSLHMAATAQLRSLRAAARHAAQAALAQHKHAMELLAHALGALAPLAQVAAAELRGEQGVLMIDLLQRQVTQQINTWQDKHRDAVIRAFASHTESTVAPAVHAAVVEATRDVDTLRAEVAAAVAARDEAVARAQQEQTQLQAKLIELQEAVRVNEERAARLQTELAEKQTAHDEAMQGVASKLRDMTTSISEHKCPDPAPLHARIAALEADLAATQQRATDEALALRGEASLLVAQMQRVRAQLTAAEQRAIEMATQHAQELARLATEVANMNAAHDAAVTAVAAAATRQRETQDALDAARAEIAASAAARNEVEVLQTQLSHAQTRMVALIDAPGGDAVTLDGALTQLEQLVPSLRAAAAAAAAAVTATKQQPTGDAVECARLAKMLHDLQISSGDAIDSARRETRTLRADLERRTAEDAIARKTNDAAMAELQATVARLTADNEALAADLSAARLVAVTVSEYRARAERVASLEAQLGEASATVARAEQAARISAEEASSAERRKVAANTLWTTTHRELVSLHADRASSCPRPACCRGGPVTRACGQCDAKSLCDQIRACTTAAEVMAAAAATAAVAPRPELPFRIPRNAKAGDVVVLVPDTMHVWRVMGQPELKVAGVSVTALGLLDMATAATTSGIVARIVEMGKDGNVVVARLG